MGIGLAIGSALGGIASGILGGRAQRKGAQRAGAVQEQAAQAAIEELSAAEQRALDLGEPFREAALQALQQFRSLTIPDLPGAPQLAGIPIPGGGPVQLERLAQTDIEETPGFRFQAEQARRGARRAAAARGQFFSGAGIEAETQAIQRLAAQETVRQQEFGLRQQALFANIGAQEAGLTQAGQRLQIGATQAENQRLLQQAQLQQQQALFPFQQQLALSGQLAQIGLPFVSGAQQTVLGTGRGIAGALTGAGQAQAQAQLGIGQARAGIFGGIGQQLGQIPGLLLQNKALDILKRQGAGQFGFGGTVGFGGGQVSGIISQPFGP